MALFQRVNALDACAPRHRPHLLLALAGPVGFRRGP